jgi:hypothetical protein
MRKQLSLLVSASIGLGALAMTGCERSNTGTPNASNNTSNSSAERNAAADNKVINNKDDASRTAGSVIPGDQIGAADLTKIYGTLGETAEAALTRNGLDDLAERLTPADKSRIGKLADQKSAELDGRIDALNKDYNAKYNGKFNLDKSKVFENWAKVQKTGEDKDTTRANAMIPAGHGLPELTVPLVKDHQSWRIDAPDDVTGAQLKQNVQDELTAIDSMKDQWPGDQLDAQRAIVHRVLMAVLNKPLPK